MAPKNEHRVRGTRRLAMQGLKRARALLKGAKQLYKPWKSECEGLVTRWEWGTFTRHSLEPGYFEVHKFTPGRLLRGEPKPPRSGATGHGFDGSGRLVVTRDLTEFPGMFNQDFVRYCEDHWELLRFDYAKDKKAQRADVYGVENGRVSSISTAAANGNWFVQTFRYDDQGRLVEIERTGQNDPYGPIHDFRDLDYDADGSVVRVWWRYPDGRKVIDFERPSETQTFPSVRDDLLVAVSKAILELLRKWRLDSPAYALSLIWCDAEYRHLIPPAVKVGRASERQALLDEKGHKKATESFMWNPAEWKLGGQPVLPKSAARKAERANQDIWQNERFGETEEFFRQIAADLSKLDLPIPKTDDFVCYASNIELGRGIDDVRRQAPKKLLKLLEQRRFL
jgi:YD repeat-containing protein